MLDGHLLLCSCVSMQIFSRTETKSLMRLPLIAKLACTLTYVTLFEFIRLLGTITLTERDRFLKALVSQMCLAESVSF